MAYNLKYGKLFEGLKYKLIERFKLGVPTHDGDLRKSISAGNTIIKDDKEAGAELQLYMASYWAPVEFGSIPHWTSVDNLKKWAKDKWGDEDLAYALQHHIAKHGTKPHPFIRKVLDEELDDMFYDSIKLLGEAALIKI